MTTTFPIIIAPATRDELYQRYGIFAVLVPFGAPAVEAFSDLVDQILLAPREFQPLFDRQCIFLYRSERRPLDEVIDIGPSFFLPEDAQQGSAGNTLHQDDLADASDTTCTSTISAETPNLLWHGFVAFSLNHSPAAPRFGWSVGYQPTWHELTRSPDIPLCSQARARHAKLHRRHLTFSFWHGTGTLAFKAIHDNTLKNFLDLGTLQYWMIYVQVSETVQDEMKRATERYIQGIPGGDAVITSASATPTAYDKTVGRWKVMGVAGRGSSTIMSTALHSEHGTLAVVRHKQKNDSGYRRFLQEIDTERSTTLELAPYRFGSSHIQRFRDCIKYPASGEVFAFYEPLCPYNLATILENEDYSDLERQILFTQLVFAIRDLHAVDRIHGDIKTRNICVRSKAPPCAVLIDTASIRNCISGGLECTPGFGGTVGYMAPEQESATTYDKPVDVWATGCVGVELLLGERNFTTKYLSVNNAQGRGCNPWRPRSSYGETLPPDLPDIENTQRRFGHFRAALAKHARGSREELLHRMLDPDPARRITASDATAHEFLRGEYERSSEASSTSRPGAKRTQSNR
ncbi:Putative protein kinase [Septoria linicola]|uniref:Protein kinase domain-containing protein n=1 Tax=Septoria linicola TaxID=215465 RepID=A0A9Q9B0T8_9PEZI|nr:Putative protein kinase [Septoria linicola]